MRYENFDLLLDRADAGYRARVIRSLAGDAVVSFAKPPVPASIDPQGAGAALYATAFGGDVGVCFRRSLDEAQRRGVGLRIRIRIDPSAWDLAEFPWEYLYLRDLDRFLALSPTTPVVRYLELSQRSQPLAVQPPAAVLAVVASPRDQQVLAVEQEWAQLQQALAPLKGLVTLDLLSHVTLEGLQARLRSGPVHVLHFVGHGYFDPDAGEGGLVLEDAEGDSQYVSGKELALLLTGKDELRLAFLGACEGGRAGDKQPFGGVAHRLVQAGIPAVIAMQTPVSAEGSRALSTELYRGLAAGAPVDAALSDARRLMAAQGEAFEWGVPVFFSRSDDLRLLDVPQQVAIPDFEPMRFEPRTIIVPAGSFLMGSKDAGAAPTESPQHSITLPAYRIGAFPVTVAQYAEFIQRTKTDPPREGWFLRKPSGKLDHPVAGVSWPQAVAYCRWLSAETGRRYRLPTEAEWEKAARGTGGCLYPWGDAWVEDAAQVEAGDTAPVTGHPGGASPYSCQDMLGNVQEWTSTIWGGRKEQPDYAYPYDATDGREDPVPVPPAPQPLRIHRGGSYREKRDDVRCAARGASSPDSQLKWRGFRVVMEV
jgi:formylglycine-generating enzyme required for sulfatase activity